jgi:hypothetical protein
MVDRVLLLLVLLLAVGTPSARADVAADFTRCLQVGRCRMEDVCSFALAPDHARCFNETCTNLTGHLMAVHNGLDVAVNATWDVLGHVPASAVHSGPLHIVAGGARYFDTGVTGPHSVRLAVDGETVDVVVADANATTTADGGTPAPCTADEACDYLVRACYDAPDEVRCIDYARHCGGFAKQDSARGPQCVQTCLAMHYDARIRNPYSVDVAALVAVVESQEVRGGETNRAFDVCVASAPVVNSDDTHTVALTLLVIALVVAVLSGCLCFVREMRRRRKRNELWGQDHEVAEL